MLYSYECAQNEHNPSITKCLRQLCSEDLLVFRLPCPVRTEKRDRCLKHGQYDCEMLSGNRVILVLKLK